MKKTIATLLATLVLATPALAKPDAPRNAYMCLTAYTVSIDLLKDRPDLQVWSKEMKQKLLNKYMFDQTRVNITYQNFSTQYELMFSWQQNECSFISKI